MCSIIDLFKNVNEGRMNLPQEAIGPKESVPVFLRKPIATCDFDRGGGGPDPLFHPGSTNGVLDKDILIYMSEKTYHEG